MSTRRAPARRGPPVRGDSDRDTSLSEDVCRALVGVLFALARRKVRKKAILRLVTTTLALMPDETTLTSSNTRNQVIDTAHLLSIWRSERPYIHRGKPRPLPLRGPAPSMESLIHEAAPNLDLTTAMRLLNAANVLEKRGQRFLYRTDVVGMRGSAYQAQQNLELLDAVTINLDHNAAPAAWWPSWRAQAAECPRFPIRELPRLRSYIFKQSEHHLRDIDDYMLRLEKLREPSEPTTRAGVQVTQYEHSYREQSPEFLITLDSVLHRLGVRPRRRAVRQRAPVGGPRRK